jgi:hypothetical protein
MRFMSSTPRLLLPPHVRQRNPPPTWEGSGLLPPWVLADHPEARRGTLLLRAFDPQLIACFDPMSGYEFQSGRRLHDGCFTIWGMSETKGRVPLLLLENPDGTPQAAPIPWDWWLGELHRMREGPLSCDVAAEANEKVRQDADRERDAEMEERLGLTAEGLLRNRCEDPRDVTETVNRQVAGVKPPPRERKTYTS